MKNATLEAYNAVRNFNLQGSTVSISQKEATLDNPLHVKMSGSTRSSLIRSGKIEKHCNGGWVAIENGKPVIGNWTDVDASPSKPGKDAKPQRSIHQQIADDINAADQEEIADKPSNCTRKVSKKNNVPEKAAKRQREPKVPTASKINHIDAIILNGTTEPKEVFAKLVKSFGNVDEAPTMTTIRIRRSRLNKDSYRTQYRARCLAVGLKITS